MKFLITNLHLKPFRGTENWCYAMGCQLIRMGHKVEIYSPNPNGGEYIFETAGIRFNADGGQYDLIFENHNVIDPNKFRGPVVHTCHGIIDAECPIPDVINVAVSERVAKYWGLHYVVKNGIDCERFNIVKPPNKTIKNILSLCSSDSADDVIRSICSRFNYNLTTTFRKEVFAVNELINQNDLVIGVGRSLYDAMACGRPVISFDDRPYLSRMHGLGYVTPEMMENNQDNMTGNGNYISEEQLACEIEKYNPDDGVKNRNYILNNMNIETKLMEYVTIIRNNCLN